MRAAVLAARGLDARPCVTAPVREASGVALVRVLRDSALLIATATDVASAVVGVHTTTPSRFPRLLIVSPRVQHSTMKMSPDCGGVLGRAGVRPRRSLRRRPGPGPGPVPSRARAWSGTLRRWAPSSQAATSLIRMLKSECCRARRRTVTEEPGGRGVDGGGGRTRTAFPGDGALQVERRSKIWGAGPQGDALANGVADDPSESASAGVTAGASWHLRHASEVWI